MAYEKPLPQVNADNKAFWNGCKEHELRFQKCQECGLVRWPPSIICPDCHSYDTGWTEATGKGKIWSFVVYHVAYDKAFESELPYVVASVQLEEGPRILTNIVGCSPAEVKCDLPVEVVWEDIEGGFSLPKFKLLS